jgi:hypothetical protein
VNKCLRSQLKKLLVKRKQLKHHKVMLLIGVNSQKIADRLKSARKSRLRLSLRRARLTIIALAENQRISLSVTDLMRAPSSSLFNLSSRETKRVLKKLRLRAFAVASTIKLRVAPSAMAVTRISLSGDLSVYIFMIERTLI